MAIAGPRVAADPLSNPKAELMSAEDPGGAPSLASPRRILTALSLGSSATFLAIVMSAAATKAIALFAGAEGIALVGLYRNVASFIVGVVTFGSSVIVVQRVAAARSQQESSDVIAATALALALQGTAILILLMTIPNILARWLFGGLPAPGQHGEMRIVFAMAFVNLLLQTVTAVLKGQPNVKPAMTLGVVTAASSLLVIYPLLRMGRTGLAINVGSGSLVGACLGIYYIRKIFRPRLFDRPLSERLRLLRGTWGASLWLTFQSLGLLGGALAVQALVNRRYGLEALGQFNAAMLIIDTIVLMLMSSARAYTLPAFGRLEDGRHKEALFTRMLALLIVANAAAALFLIFGPRYILWILFSKQLAHASSLLAPFGFCLIGLSFGWSYNTFLLHKGDIPLFVTLDLIGVLLLVGIIYLGTWMGLPLEFVAWTHALVYIVGAAIYALAVRWKYGDAYLNPRSVVIGILSLAGLGLGYGLSLLNSPYPSLVFCGACVAGGCFWAARFPVREWLGWAR